MMVKNIEIPCEVKRVTYHDPNKQNRKAILINDGTKEVWCPWSLVIDYSEDKDVITSIFVPEWWAEKEGLI